MAVTDNQIELFEPTREGATLALFEIWGLFGRFDHVVRFPQINDESPRPEILIIEGANGTGKTTIFNMINGIVDSLDFDPYRKVPFSRSRLTLSNGHYIEIRWDENDKKFPLIVSNNDVEVRLVRDRERSSYSKEQLQEIEEFRSKSIPELRNVVFNLIAIDRAFEDNSDERFEVQVEAYSRVNRRVVFNKLSSKVHSFLREAQVNYRNFFQAGQLELLPRILKSLDDVNQNVDRESLISRIEFLKENSKNVTRFGLQSDEQELETLITLLHSEQASSSHSLSVLSTYVQIHENRAEARELIATRLSLFELIMDDFLIGKTVRIDYRNGLKIMGGNSDLSEKDLSSGEFHFLYMMVAALLCKRVGTILAIDEPEMSLHTTWQRKLISALAKCASGASPIFMLATHSSAISFAHQESVQRLSPID